MPGETGCVCKGALYRTWSAVGINIESEDQCSRLITDSTDRALRIAAEAVRERVLPLTINE